VINAVVQSNIFIADVSQDPFYINRFPEPEHGLFQSYFQLERILSCFKQEIEWKEGVEEHENYGSNHNDLRRSSEEYTAHTCFLQETSWNNIYLNLLFRTQVEEIFLLSWFDIAYSALNIIAIFYCFREYSSSRKKPFQVFGLGFTCLLISDFIWILAVIPGLNVILVVYGYLRLGLYAAFTLLFIHALQMFSSRVSVD